MILLVNSHKKNTSFKKFYIYLLFVIFFFKKKKNNKMSTPNHITHLIRLIETLVFIKHSNFSILQNETSSIPPPRKFYSRERYSQFKTLSVFF
jgi:hypothetical protein